MFVVRNQSISLTPAPVRAEMAAFPFLSPLGLAAPRRQREAEMPWNTGDGSLCSSDLQKVEREMLPSAESERRMMDGSKQSNSVALLYGKRTNICQA